MPGNASTEGAIREVDRLFGLGTLSGLSEGELLDRFLSRRDERAFEALVERHGPMVLRTCRALLGDRHEAEDAFQATFLVLARRGRTIRDRDLIGPWLHRVARRVAARAGRASARRRRREVPSTEAVSLAAAPDSRVDPDRRAVAEEVDRLPGPYRRVVVLCDLQGLTHAEAACRLGWPLGTVKGRQSRARDLLRRRLARRGLATAGTIVGAPALDAAALPPSLLALTARAAAGFAARGAAPAGTVPAAALALAHGVGTAMTLHRLALVALACLLPAGALATALVAAPRPADDGPAAEVPAAVAEVPDAPAAALDPRAEALLGLWQQIPADADPDAAPTGPDAEDAAIRLQVRRADGRVAALLGREGAPLIVQVITIKPSGVSSVEQSLALVDPSASPGRIDLADLESFAFGGTGRNAATGIYRVDGDRLSLHLAPGDGPRPSGFEQAEEGASLATFRRISAEPEPTAAAEAGTPSPVPAPSHYAGSTADPDGPGRGAPAAGLIGTWRRLLTDGVSPSIETTLEIRPGAALPPEAGPVVNLELIWTYAGRGAPRPRPVGSTRRRLASAVLDPRGAPATIDLFFPDGPATQGDPSHNLGIIEQTGDVLTLCWRGEAGPPRPEAFGRDVAKASILEVYVRERPLPDPPRQGLEPPAPDEAARANAERRDRLAVEQEKLIEELTRLKPEAELLAIEVEVLGDQYREALDQLAAQATARTAGGDGQEATAQRAVLDDMRQRVHQLREEFLETSREHVRLSEREREIEAALGRGVGAGEPAAGGPGFEALERRLDAIESRLDLLIDRPSARATGGPD